MRDFKRLSVWEKAHALVLATYRATKRFPQDERYGLVSQMRRSAESIPSNIAEGAGRATPGDVGRFMAIAAGSSTELEYHLLVARDLGYLSDDVHGRLDDQVNEVQKMLAAYIRSVKGERTS